MMASDDGPDRVLMDKARCPRCGYDQRGMAESWTESCPMSGTCSECGLEFEWSELLSPKIRPPRWCVEYGRWWAVPWRTALTLGMALWPPSFWRSLKMTHRPRWRRIALFYLCMFGPLYVALAASHGYYGWLIWREYDQGIAAFNKSKAGSTAVISLPVGLIQANPSLAPPASVKTTVSGGVISWTQLSPTITNSVDPVLAVVQFAVLPFSGRTLEKPPGPVRSQLWRPGLSSWSVFPAPREVLHLRFQVPERPRPLMLSMQFAVLVQIVVPLGLLVAPISRRTARVRWAHIVRIAAYGLLVLWVPVLALLLFMPSGARTWALEYQSLLGRMGLACFAIIPITVLIWLRFAIARYLPMPHAWAVAGAITAMAVLLLMLCGYFNFIIDEWPGVYLLLTGQG